MNERLLPPGLNTAVIYTVDGFVPCWAFRTPGRDLFAFGLSMLVLNVKAFGSPEDAEVLQAEINLLQIEDSDLELFASQDEALMLELENNDSRSARESEEEQ